MNQRCFSVRVLQTPALAARHTYRNLRFLFDIIAVNHIITSFLLIFDTGGEIRTHTLPILRRFPLPLGYTCVPDIRFELILYGLWNHRLFRWANRVEYPTRNSNPDITASLVQPLFQVGVVGHNYLSISTPGWIRTVTYAGLNRMPLPLGYRRSC